MDCRRPVKYTACYEDLTFSFAVGVATGWFHANSHTRWLRKYIKPYQVHCVLYMNSAKVEMITRELALETLTNYALSGSSCGCRQVFHLKQTAATSFFTENLPRSRMGNVFCSHATACAASSRSLYSSCSAVFALSYVLLFLLTRRLTSGSVLQFSLSFSLFISISLCNWWPENAAG